MGIHTRVCGLCVGIAALVLGGCTTVKPSPTTQTSVNGSRSSATTAAQPVAVQAAPPAEMPVATATPATTQPRDSRRTLFDSNWLFQAGDAAGEQAADFADGSWRALDLPHDWSIEGPFDQQFASGTAYLPAGIAWYRKHFTFPEADAGKMVSIEFDGVYKNSTVYLNGHELGTRPYGYSSFEYDLTPYLNATGDNVIAVRVDHHDNADSRWYSGSGIYRKVYLIATDPVHVDDEGVAVQTLSASADVAIVQVDTSVVTPPNADLSGLYQLSTRIVDNGGRTVASASTEEWHPINHEFQQVFQIAHPLLWSVDRPTMYSVVTDVSRNGATVDSVRTPLGIRTFAFDPNTGFWLNGVSMKLKGVCLHEDAGALGSAVPRQVWERRLRTLKEAGTNAIRCSHNPPDPQFLDLCDRLGFLVMDEAFDEWTTGKNKWIAGWNKGTPGKDGYHTDFPQWADRDITDMVRRDRNHPSIILWSIGNEIDYPNDPYPLNDPELPAIAERLVRDVKSVDASRPVTAACAAIASNLFYPELDVVGYNYQEDRYLADHAKHPDRIIYGSENKPSLAAWLAVADHPFICGQFLWTGIDYLGEAKAFPNHASTDGFIDLAGFPKPEFYFRQSLWTDAPMVKIERDAAGKLVCYTNLKSVEFSQKGIMAGTIRPLPSATHVIDVPGDPKKGPITVVGYQNGNPVAQDIYTLPGAAAAVKMRQYKTLLGPGDGPNVAQIELGIVDAKGNRVVSAQQDVAITLNGPGRLLGIESGDNDSLENYQTPHHKVFHGRMIVYVQTQGRVEVEATAAGLSSAKILVGN